MRFTTNTVYALVTLSAIVIAGCDSQSSDDAGLSTAEASAGGPSVSNGAALPPQNMTATNSASSNPPTSTTPSSGVVETPTAPVPASASGTADGVGSGGAASSSTAGESGGSGGNATATGGSAGDNSVGETDNPTGDSTASGAGMTEADDTAGSSETGESGGTGGVPSEGAAGAASTGSTFHVFLLLGQSNMAGYPKAQQADREEDPRVTVLGFDDCAATGRQVDEWDVAAPPLHECWNDAIGPGDYFAKTLIDVVPEGDTIGLVPCAISGEKIEPFLKVGGTRYDWILGRARLAQEAGGVIEGILFHQGESNNGDSSWPGKVNTLVTDLRTDLDLGEVPFLAGELLYSGGTSGHNTLVNQLPSVVSNAFVVSANGLVVDPADTQWNLHFGHDSQVTFGQRYAEQMIEALGW